MVCFLLGSSVFFQEVRNDSFAIGHALGTLFPLGISVCIGKEKYGSSAQHTKFVLFHLTLATCRQPYIVREDSRADDGTLLGFNQYHHLVGIEA